MVLFTCFKEFDFFKKFRDSPDVFCELDEAYITSLVVHPPEGSKAGYCGMARVFERPKMAAQAPGIDWRNIAA